MKAQGYTIEMLSLISNIPVGTLSKIISGITANPGFETMSAIATALNCSLDEFSGRPVTIPYDTKNISAVSNNWPSVRRNISNMSFIWNTTV